MLMPCDHIDELVKAKLYVEDPSRFVWADQKTVVWMSSDTTHLLVCVDGTWQCDCFYDMHSHLPCGHVRALEEVIRRSQNSDSSTQSRSLPDFLEQVPARYDGRDQVKTSSITTYMPRR